MEELIFKVIKEAKLANSSIHGVGHWQRVERNGVYLCQFNHANIDVVRLFALFHDSKREDDYRDLEHGPRAEVYLRGIKDLVPLEPDHFEDLCIACRTHTVGKIPENETIATCWDSDRLEIGRVGIQPSEKFLINQEAKRIAREPDFDVLENFKHSSLISVA
jgi:uncharacterized protein